MRLILLLGRPLNAFVDLWQRTSDIVCPPIHGGDALKQYMTYVAFFMNKILSRNLEPDYVPPTFILGLENKRQKLYVPMDFCEVTLDSLVHTGVLSNAIPQLNRVIIP